MNSDLLFGGASCASFCAAGWLVIRDLRARSARQWLPAILWLAFGTGMLLQALAPNLEIKNGRFVVPEKHASGKVITDPIGLVGVERSMQLGSGLLTGLSGIGLAVFYRRRVAPRHYRAEWTGLQP